MNYNFMWDTNPNTFAIISQFKLKNYKNQEHRWFLTVFTRTNEPNEFIASSLLEDINFPL